MATCNAERESPAQESHEEEMKSSDVIKCQLFLTSWRESQGAGHLTGEMIAWALANRVRKGMGNWQEVLTSVERYRAHEIPPSNDFPNLWEPHVVKLMQQVDNVYDNLGRDLANGGMFYCFSEREIVPWFKQAVIESGDYSRKACMNSFVIFG